MSWNGRNEGINREERRSKSGSLSVNQTNCAGNKQESLGGCCVSGNLDDPCRESRFWVWGFRAQLWSQLKLS